LAGDVKFKQTLSLDNIPNVSYADIVIENSKGQRDSYLEHVWTSFIVKHGDSRWPLSDFKTVVIGEFDGILGRGNTKLIIKARDKIQSLNKPISESTLNNGTENDGQLIPVLLGECCNISPLLTNPATHEYQIHLTANEDVIEPRDFGLPTSCTKDLANGKFTLNSAPAGTITVSAQGDKTPLYKNTVAELIKNAVKDYDGNFTDDDINLANFSTFDTEHLQPVGDYIKSRKNILNIIQYLAGSVGAQVYTNWENKLEIKEIEFPPTDTPTEIHPMDVVENSLSFQKYTEPKAAIKIGYCKNHTVQTDLQTGVNPEHKAFFAKEWMTVTEIDTATADLHGLDTDPELVETALLTKADAQAHAQKQLDIWKQRRRLIRFTGFPWLLTLKIGQVITLFSGYFDLTNGDTGVLLSLDKNYTTGMIEGEVLI